MKKILLFITILFSSYAKAQIYNICETILNDVPSGSYIKDIDGKLDKFAGVWVWTNGNETVTYKLQKVVHQYDSELGSYEDYMIGNYSYTKNNGTITVVNTLNSADMFNPEINLLSQFHPMFAFCPKNETTIDFIFKDIVLNKDGCRAVFEFLPGSTTQMKLTQKNREEGIGVLINVGDPIPVFNYGFTIPNDIVLTKQ